jgi:hypothetical protein
MEMVNVLSMITFKRLGFKAQKHYQLLGLVKTIFQQSM